MLQTADEPGSDDLTEREERTRRANSPAGRFLRYIGLLVGIVIGWNIGIALGPEDAGNDAYGYALLMSASLGAILFIATPYMTIGVLSWLRGELRRIEASDIIAIAVGLLAGGLVSTLLAWPISMLPSPFGSILPFVAAVVACTLAVLATITKKHELSGFLGMRRAPESTGDASEASLTKGTGELRIDTTSQSVSTSSDVLVDTSAIIDGRIAELVASGFLNYHLVVPQFVLHELQLVADSGDHHKRTRGSRGLNVLERLQREHPEQFEVRSMEVEGDDVDAQLVNLAQQYSIPILSGDTNLERVAGLQGATVLNLHQLAEIMRPSLTTGDMLDLKIVQPGREYRQGVGFLDDGTMVVVDEGEPHIGETIPIIITRTLQTSSGRMMFARLHSQPDG